MEETLADSSKIKERLADLRIGRDVSEKAPKVSVIIPAYNASEYVAGTLDSVFAQTFHDFEVVVVNDGSKDTNELELVLGDYFDRITYGRQKNFGASEARNSAIALARGEMIAFLDGDDFWFPKYLESQIRFLETNKLDMVYCDAELFGDNYFKGSTYMETAPSEGEVDTRSLINGTCNVITSGTIVTRKILDRVNLFDTSVRSAEDFDLWFRIAKHGAKIGYQREVLIRYRMSTNSLSGTNVDRAERNLLVLSSIKEKYPLTGKEFDVLEDQILLCEAEVELEKGKSSLIKGDFKEARKRLRKANAYYRKPKLLFLNLLIMVSPALTLKLFKRMRSAEYAFISHREK